MNSEVMNDPYEEFVRQHPELGERIQAVVDKGRLYLENGSLVEARREFQRALALFPHVPAALNNLALLAYGEGDRDRAAAYLQQLLEFAPAEPTANALMARCWGEMGAIPLAHSHAATAVRSVTAAIAASGGSDPSRARRALEFTCQALAALEDDSLLVRLYSETGKPDLLPDTVIHVAIAYYNRGDLDMGTQLWEQVLQDGDHETPARVYLDMVETIRDHGLLPFRLDHCLDMPRPEAGRRVWLVRVPSLFVAAALTRLYHGSGEEAEEALSLLARVGLPGIERVLIGIGGDITRPVRLRLLAGLQLLAIGDPDRVEPLVSAIPRAATRGEEEALWCLLQGLLAETREKFTEASRLSAEGMRCLERAGDLPKDHPFRQMLMGLAKRSSKRAGSQESVVGKGEAVEEDTYPEELQAPYEALRLPDAEWLRQALQSKLSQGLDEALMKRPREDVAELARRLGEHSAERLETSALVRRLAVRMRSLQLERVMGKLSTDSREALEWLTQQEEAVALPQLHRWLVTRLSEIDPWVVIEELYRSCLVDIGRAKDDADAVLRTDDVIVGIPADLYGRFLQGGQ